MSDSSQTSGTASNVKEVDRDHQENGEGSLDYDYLLCTIPDIHGSPRGRIVPRHLIPRVLKHGFGLFQGIGNFGLSMEIPKGLTDYAKEHYANGTFLPILDTVRQLHWSSSPGGRRLGHVHCQLLYKGQPDPVCSRETALRQLRRLDAMGLRFNSSFELEFTVFQGGDPRRPMGGGRRQYGNVDLLDDNMDFFLDLLDCLKASGLPIEFFNNEFELGQYEITMEPREGVESADAAFMARYGIRAFSRRRGHQATFMARPKYPEVASGFHLNHSLWTKDGKDVFFDGNDPDKLSSFMRHWVAGLLHHVPALCAIFSPTVNCYQRFSSGLAPPSLVYWNLDDRTCSFRAKVSSSSGAYLENRLPSSACNPYLVLAATIAAGLDGVERQLPCPKPGPPEKGQAQCKLPASLEEALDALDKDVVLKEAIGSKLLSYLAVLKRDHELSYFHNNTTPDMSRAERVEVERKYYMPYI